MSLPDRIADIGARVAEHHDIEGAFGAWLICDGCGLGIALDPADPTAPKGWKLGGGDQDFCPTCATSR